MKVIDPNITNHTLILIPRFTPTTSLTFTLFNEATKESETVSNSYSVTDGKLSLLFTYTFTEDDKRVITLEEGSDVVYRGKLIVTAQESQEYKETNGLYFYE